MDKTNKMDCLHCQRDYISDTITVHYEGVYDYDEMMEYVNKCYDKVYGKVIEHEEPSEYRKYKNNGIVIIE